MREYVILSLLMIGLVFAGCGRGTETAGQAAGPESAPVDGGTAVISTISDFDAFNDLVSTDFETNQVRNFMLFMPLLRLDEELNFEPYLADSFGVAEDGLSLTFRIREGVTWHDGAPVTADDVVWTLEMIRRPEIAYANSAYFQYLADVEQIDDRRLRVHFSEAHAEAEMNYTQWQTMPKHLLEDVDPSDMRNAEFNRNPVGNGPFRFVSWDPERQVVLEANDDFVLGRPHLDRVVFRVIPEQTTELTELLTGGIDYMRAVPPREMERVLRSDRAEAFSYPTRSYTFLAWNTRHPLFEDPEVRRALTMAIDREQIVNALLYGYGEVAVADVMPFQWPFHEDLEPWPYDPERAKEMLAAAGWVDTDGDGVLDKDGMPFRFELRTNQGNDLREDIIVIVQGDLAKIGVDVQPQLMEWNTHITDLKAKRFDAAVSGWSVDFNFDPTDLFSTRAIEGKYNYPSYSNPRADTLMQQALTTLDRERAKPLWYEYQEIIHRDQPYTFLYYLEERVGMSNRLRGVEADARGYLVSVTDWWIPASMQRERGNAPIASADGR